MAYYYKNFTLHKSEIMNNINGVPDIAKIMADRQIISSYEKFQILEMKDNKKRLERLLFHVEYTYQFKKFIEILEETGNIASARKIRGIDKENAFDELWLRRELTSARDRIRSLEDENDKLKKEKESLKLKIKELESALAKIKRNTAEYREKSRKLETANSRLAEVEDQIERMKHNKDNTQDITEELQSQLQKQHHQLEQQGQKMDRMEQKMDAMLKMMAGHFSTGPSSNETTQPNVRASFPLERTPSNAQVVKLPPLEKRKK